MLTVLLIVNNADDVRINVELSLSRIEIPFLVAQLHVCGVPVCLPCLPFPLSLVVAVWGCVLHDSRTGLITEVALMPLVLLYGLYDDSTQSVFVCEQSLTIM